MVAVSSGVRDTAAEIDRRLGEPPVLQFPDGWTLSTSWQRAQEADDLGGPVNPAERIALFDDGGAPHTVLFAISGGELRAECDCPGYDHRQWCAHVASCWWRWVRAQIAVTDLDAERTHLTPPWWLSVGGER